MMELLAILKAFLGNFFVVFLLGIQMSYVIRGSQGFAFVISSLIGTAQVFAFNAVLVENPSLLVQAAFVFGGAVGIVLSIRYSKLIAPKLDSWFSRAKTWLVVSKTREEKLIYYHVCHECGHVFHEDYMTKENDAWWRCMPDCTSEEVMAIRRAEEEVRSSDDKREET